MPREPNWSKSLFSDSSVCTWFYAFAILNAIAAIAGIVGAVLLAKQGAKTSELTTLIAGGTIGFLNAWFLFLVCNRAINKEGYQRH